MLAACQRASFKSCSTLSIIHVKSVLDHVFDFSTQNGILLRGQRILELKATVWVRISIISGFTIINIHT